MKADHREKFSQHRTVERFIVHHQNLSHGTLIADDLWQSCSSIKRVNVAPRDFKTKAPRYSVWVTSAALRLFKVESDINGILPAGGGPLPFISFLP